MPSVIPHKFWRMNAYLAAFAVSMINAVYWVQGPEHWFRWIPDPVFNEILAWLAVLATCFFLHKRFSPHENLGDTLDITDKIAVFSVAIAFAGMKVMALWAVWPALIALVICAISRQFSQ